MTDTGEYPPDADPAGDGDRLPAWKQRAVERSLRSAKARAGQRVQRFLDSAQAIITEKGSTDFTVQEVVDRSRQSLRSFYLQFDGKHDLLLALYEDALGRTTDQIRAATANSAHPLDKVRTAVELLFQLCRPDPHARRPLFTEFAPQLLSSHPAQIRLAHAALFALFTELLTEADRDGRLHLGANPRRLAALTMQTVMFIAQPTATAAESRPITADEVWNFCAHGLTTP
ncbi:AcrR family transcriptional regulator [Nocardia transvalensis]|uniref:AcrR family transcriptional regulator n=1 Tax=Nocardia transvalensis TaxID=37333 RepID=A0A7W9PG25_9NOCA|nr:TetR/AcrR family transcriptional regulator [Nocardia transvalensis]MBB5915447.1 AcrR family transcriptional regulator [Nocardia transvalensis]